MYATDFAVSPGDLVAAPLRSKTVHGIVSETSETPPQHALKSLQKIIRKSVLGEPQLATAKFIMEYYAAAAGKTFRLFAPERIWSDQPLKRKSSEHAIKPLPRERIQLTTAQRSATDQLLSAQKPCLLHGITGSGKTEVYLTVIREILRRGKQAILLVPEIALTPQLTSYFAAAIPPEKIAVLHSNLSTGAKLTTWERIHAGEVKLVIGSRSALFSPTRKLGIIILDEEHEWTYKNDQMPRYHTRAAASKLAEAAGAQLVFGSATPSLETYHAAKTKRVKLIELPERINSQLPKVEIIDLRNELKKGNYSLFSERLAAKIQEKLERQEQIILLLNKRGFASAVVCRDCGFVLECQNCTLSLTFHKFQNECICHACGAVKTPPTICPNCKSVAIRFLGSGTQKIESELKNLFPHAKVLRADRDTTAARGSHQEIYETFRERKADILVGTQIVAKGLDLPNVSLVGILLADVGLHFPDFRAAEKTFALLTQAAGRAGRRQATGEVIIQTYSPQHPAIRAASRHAYRDFCENELRERQQLGWPPFVKVVKFTFVNPIEKIARSSAENFAAELKKLGEQNVSVAPALITKLHNKFHWHVIWRGPDPRPLLKKIPDVQCRIDVDPVNLC